METILILEEEQALRTLLLHIIHKYEIKFLDFNSIIHIFKRENFYNQKFILDISRSTSAFQMCKLVSECIHNKKANLENFLIIVSQRQLLKFQHMENLSSHIFYPNSFEYLERKLKYL